MIWLAGTFLYTHHHRPGAITNMTVGEYRKARKVQEGRWSYKTIRVIKHKTETTGTAKITISGNMLDITAKYVKHIHPLRSPSDLMFPNSKGKPLDHLSQRVQQLASHSNFTLPTATMNHHAGATESARTCSKREREQVSVQMPHSKWT